MAPRTTPESSLGGAPLAQQTSTSSADGSPYGDTTDSGRPKDGASSAAPCNGWTVGTLNEVEQLSRRLLMYRNMVGV